MCTDVSLAHSVIERSSNHMKDEECSTDEYIKRISTRAKRRIAVAFIPVIAQILCWLAFGTAILWLVIEGALTLRGLR